jgi:ribonuclease T1
MRLTGLWRGIALVVLLWGGPCFAQLSDDPQALAAFAEQAGLRDAPAFVETVRTLRDTGHLPPRYVTKDEARARGWRGGGLCSVWPGHVIGGDVFNNFGRQLPSGPGRRYYEADLDTGCGQRGAKRLIYSNDAAIFVTLDHYNTFTQVP